jgi:hypothetical protein
MDVVSGITEAVYEVGDVISDMIMAAEVRVYAMLVLHSIVMAHCIDLVE